MDVTVEPGASARERIVELTDGGCEVAVDCSGACSKSNAHFVGSAS